MARRLDSPADRETLEVLNPFLEVLRSTAPISIPLQTLEGALGHFFATLKDDQLITLTQDVLNSTSLWRALGSDGVKKALRYAPGAKVAALRPNTKDTFFKRNQLDKAAQKWLSEVLGAIANAKPPANAPTLYLGLLEGLDDVPDVKWGRARTELEEEVVVAVSEKFEKSGKEAVMYYCEAAKHVKPARLRVLNLKMVVPKLSTAVFTSLGFPISISTSDEKAAFDEEKASLYAKGLSSSVQALGEGSEEDQAFAWDTIFAFTARMIECGQHYSQEWRGVQKPLVNGESWNRLKAAQTAFTTVEWPAVELLLQPTCPQSARERCSLAALIVATLSKFSILSDEPDTHLESYEKVLYGCLDIIAAEGGSRIVNRLFKDLHQPPVSDSLAAFILVVAEQLVHVMDGPSLRDIAFPLAERHIVRPEHRTSFEAANAFLLTLVEIASQRLRYDPSQAAFVDALVMICAYSLLKGARNESVKADQLGAAYPGVVRAASRRNVDLVYACIRLLDSVEFKSQDYSNTVRSIRVAVAPFVPRPDLPDYLDSLAPLILATPQHSEERLELSSLTFKTIMQDMPDESKQLAVEWWLRWRRRIEGKEDTTTARL